VLGDAGGTAVIVPGGGPFADQVRAAQKQWRFDDAAAHHMALLAMEQYGRMLTSLRPDLQPAASRAEIARARRAGSAAVWMPTRMVLREPRIAASWDITSDSLAAWLAGALGADRLVLVKSVALTEGSVAASALARRGVVDPAFPDYLARSIGEAWCLDDVRHADMARAFRTGGGPGIRVLARAEPRSGRAA
jgi:5-(aminomethyl)-3-furanmethanol phosphate kinase